MSQLALHSSVKSTGQQLRWNNRSALEDGDGRTFSRILRNGETPLLTKWEHQSQTKEELNQQDENYYHQSRSWIHSAGCVLRIAAWKGTLEGCERGAVQPVVFRRRL
ncbi:hypothetical protein Tco_1056749 [Tanacetum coccineum]|uniref:Uncharacterized protein n=1 Tax=Tanacetum coccineum TaxID=301880 RepID=A0ABQ5H593_9ASTR